MTSYLYNAYKGKDAHDWADPQTEFRAMLIGGGYVPDPDHVDLTAPGLIANELSYTERPRLLARSRVLVGDTVEHRASHIVFTSLDANPDPPGQVVIYREVDGALVACFALPSWPSWNPEPNGDNVLRWDSSPGEPTGCLFEVG